MIGNLQTNKINAVLGSAELIHSVSSLHLAQAISSRAVRKIEAGELSGPQRVLIEARSPGAAFRPTRFETPRVSLRSLREFVCRAL